MFLCMTAVALACIHAAPKAEQKPGDPIKVNAAYMPGLSALYVPGIDAKMGFFKEEGLDVNWVKFTAGPPEIAAMVSGDLQFGYIGPGAHSLCAQDQAHVLTLATMSNTDQIVVRKNSGIKSIKDLAGKKVVTQFGTSGDTILTLALNREGMTKKQLNLVNMDMAGAVAAFIAGQCDAIATWDTHTVNIKKNTDDDLIVLCRIGEFTDVISSPGSWVATPDYLEKNRDVAVRFLRGMIKINEYRKNNWEESIRLAAEFGKLDYSSINDTRDAAIYYTNEELKEMITTGEILALYQKQLNYFLENKVVEKGDVNRYVRVDLMKEAFGIK